MVECSQCLVEEMKEVGKWWRDGPRALRWGGISDRMATQSLAPSLFPTPPPQPRWSPRMVNDDQRRGADCFQSSSGWRWGFGVSVVLLLAWSEISPVKHKHRHAANLSLPFSLLAILPICPVTVGVLFGRCDKTGCLYISADIFKFMFSQNYCGPQWSGRRHLSAVVSPNETVLFFSARWGTERPFMRLCTQGHPSHKSLWAVSMTSGLPQDVQHCLYCSILLAKRERLPGTTVAHRSALSSSSLLSLNSKPDGPYVHDVHGFLR